MRRNRKKIIIVLGMHRSGTSAITRSLPLLGVNLGEALYPAAVDNPKGFWENRECLEINEELLRYYNSAYDCLDITREISVRDPFVSNLQYRAIKLINHQLEENKGLWAFKDPRTSRLLFFWQEVLRVIECDVCYVIVSRNPLSVAASLAKRNQIAEEKSHYLWLQHLLPAVLDTVGEKRIVVDYDTFMDFPFEQLARISSAFGLQVPDREGAFFKDYQDNFLEKKLRHTRFSENDLMTESHIPLDVVTAFQLLCRLSRDEVNLDDPTVIDTFSELFTRLQANSQLFYYSSQLERSIVALQAQLQESEKSIVALQAQLQEQLAGNDWLTSQRDAWQKSTLERDEQLADLNKNIATLESSKEQEIKVLRQSLSTLESSKEQEIKAVLQSLSALKSSNEQEIKERHQILEKLNVAEKTIADILSSSSWRLTEPLRFFAKWLSK